MKFRVRLGTHIEGGKEYRKGDVVESLRPLATLFPGKFEAVETPQRDEPQEEEEEEWPKPKRKSLR